MSGNESSEWIYSEWQSIEARTDALAEKIDASIARTEQLLVDIEFVRIMLEEDIV